MSQIREDISKIKTYSECTKKSCKVNITYSSVLQVGKRLTRCFTKGVIQVANKNTKIKQHHLLQMLIRPVRSH